MGQYLFLGSTIINHYHQFANELFGSNDYRQLATIVYNQNHAEDYSQGQLQCTPIEQALSGTPHALND